MNKLILEFPTFEEVKKALSKELPDVIEIIFKSQMDNIKEFEIIDHLVNAVGYYIEMFKATDNARTTFIIHFKRKS